MTDKKQQLRAFIRQFIVSGHGLAGERLTKDYEKACCDGCEADIDAIIEGVSEAGTKDMKARF